MKIRLALALALLLLATPALAEKVYIDYDPDYDFEAVETFAWSDTPETSLEKSSPLLHARLIETLERYMTEAGLEKVDADPDVYVTYHTSTDEEMSINATDLGYGYPRGWYRGGYYGRHGYGLTVGASTASVHKYLVGTLVIDAWDADSDKLVWRGMAADITVSKNPEKMGAKIDKAVAKIVSKARRAKKKRKS